MKKSDKIITSSLWSSPEKEEIRNFLLNSYNNPSKIFTLGGIWLKDAKLFTGRWKCKVRSIERNRNFYEKQTKEIKNYPHIFISHDTSSNYIKNQLEKESPFDVMFFDYQGIYNEQIENDITNLFKCTFNKNAIIAFTFFKGHDPDKAIKNTRCVQDTCCNRIDLYRSAKANAISKTIIEIAREYGYKKGYKLSEIKKIEYQNTPSRKNRHKGSNMMFLAFKIKNILYK